LANLDWEEGGSQRLNRSGREKEFMSRVDAEARRGNHVTVKPLEKLDEKTKFERISTKK
jgi:hypothetical protein